MIESKRILLMDLGDRHFVDRLAGDIAVLGDPRGRLDAGDP